MAEVEILFDWKDEVAAPGQTPSSGRVKLEYTCLECVNEAGDQWQRTMRHFYANLIDGEGSALVRPTPVGCALKITPLVAGVPGPIYVLVPDVPGPIEYCDLVQVDPNTLDPSTPVDPAWYAALAVETAEREAADADLQSQIDAVEASDVDSVNGLTGAVTVVLVENPPGSLFYELQVDN